jgi:translation initiation factor IF-1
MRNNEIKAKGHIVDSLPNCQFRVELEDGKIVLGYMSGKMKINRIKIMIGDYVDVVVPTQGIIYRIVFRYK